MWIIYLFKKKTNCQAREGESGKWEDEKLFLETFWFFETLGVHLVFR